MLSDSRMVLHSEMGAIDMNAPASDKANPSDDLVVDESIWIENGT